MDTVEMKAFHMMENREDVAATKYCNCFKSM